MEYGNLKSLRTDNDLTQEALCKELCKIGCAVSRSTYSKYESGSRNIPCDVLMKLADFYGTSCDYILGRKT